MAFTVPSGLSRAIEEGTCVVFVGAGFSMPVMPGWAKLLAKIAADERVPPDVRAQVSALIGRSPLTALDFESSAQLLREALGEESFVGILRRELRLPPGSTAMDGRVALLRGIPFRAILTTNFDGVLDGELPGRDAYQAVLRPSAHRWFDEDFWYGRPHRPRPFVVKLHGDLFSGSDPQLVFTRRDYRTRLYGSPGFQTFLRSVFAGNTVLFLGYSFSDAYLNELRSEVLALLDHRKGGEPIAYAVMNDVPPQQAAYFADHEGIQILSYETRGEEGHAGFDRWLEAIHDATNPKLRFSRLLANRSILWLDAEPRNNWYGWQYLMDASGETAHLEQVSTLAEAQARLAARSYDLVLSHWGHGLAQLGGQPASVAEALLRSMRERGHEVPVIVFASGRFAEENRRKAFKLGAQAYESDWGSLFQQIQRVL